MMNALVVIAVVLLQPTYCSNNYQCEDTEHKVVNCSAGKLTEERWCGSVYAKADGVGTPTGCVDDLYAFSHTCAVDYDGCAVVRYQRRTALSKAATGLFCCCLAQTKTACNTQDAMEKRFGNMTNMYMVKRFEWDLARHGLTECADRQMPEMEPREDFSGTPLLIGIVLLFYVFVMLLYAAGRYLCVIRVGRLVCRPLTDPKQRYRLHVEQQLAARRIGLSSLQLIQLQLIGAAIEQTADIRGHLDLLNDCQ